MPIFRIRKRRSHPAFTLVELLVVIAIIGMLVSLLLPAVQSTRETARKMQCLSQIRQLGLAVIQHEMVHSRLPPGGYISPIADTAPPRCEEAFGSGVSDCFDAFGIRGGPTYSWMVLILPFLEESALYDQFDMKTQTSIYELAEEPQAQTVGSFLCPSDNATLTSFDGSGTPVAGEGKRFAKGNYAAYVSPVHLNMQRILPAAFGGFKPGSSRGQKLARVRDGTSHTMAITEVRTLDREWDSRGAWALPFPGASLLALDWHPVGNDIVAPYRPSPTYPTRFVQTPNSPGLPDQIVECSDTAYALSREMKCQTVVYFSSAPRSLHVGGVNCVALDNHAGFVSDLVDSYIYAYLISANDQQLTSVNDYMQ